jgi:hypothetical protein
MLYKFNLYILDNNMFVFFKTKLFLFVQLFKHLQYIGFIAFYWQIELFSLKKRKNLPF